MKNWIEKSLYKIERENLKNIVTEMTYVPRLVSEHMLYVF